MRRDSVRVVWIDERRIDTAALRSAPALPEESSAVAEAVAFLKENLRDGAMAANYLIREARIAGISERTLRRAKFKLGVISKVWEYGMRSGERWGWELPGEVDDEADENGLDIGSGLPAAGDECTEADE